MPHAYGRLEELPRPECLALLGAAQVGRVVFTLGALPAVVPVTFAREDHAVLMSTSADARLAKAADGGVLAFEVDEVDPATRTGWSVVVTGVAELITDVAERARVGAAVIPWVAGRDDLLIRLPCTVVTGRRITSRPTGNGAR